MFGIELFFVHSQKWFVDRGNRISPVVNNVQVQSTSEKEGGVRMDNLEEPCVTPGLILNETPDKLIEKIVRERKAVKPLAVEELSRFLYRYCVRRVSCD